MKRKTIGIGVGVLMGVLMLVLGGIWYYIQTSAFMDKVESTAATAASEALGVPVSVARDAGECTTLGAGYMADHFDMLGSMNRNDS